MADAARINRGYLSDVATCIRCDRRNRRRTRHDQWQGCAVRRGTNVSPTRPTTALATEGIFGWTRNPLYVGIAPVLVGIALIFALDWLLLLMVPSYFILHFAVVMREEQYLESKFGDAYRSYKASVARYVWPI